MVAHGALLGWEAYTDLASGRVSWEVIADAALLASGPVTARVKPLAALLAGGGAVMLFLGEPFDAASYFAEDLYAAAAQYGDYSQCFIDGALEAFSTYAQEAEAARWVGIASTFADLSKLAYNKHWLGYRQLAALSAFPPSHGPIIPSYKFPTLLKKYGKAPYIAMDHRRFGFNQGGEPRFYQLQVDAYGLRLSPKRVKMIDEISVGRYIVKVYSFEEKDKMFGIFSGDKPLLGVYNDMGRALLFSAIFGKNSEVLRRSVEGGEVYLIRLDGLGVVEKWGVRPHDVVKDIAASLLYAVGRAEMGRIATEVTIAKPKVERVELAESLKKSLGAENALFISQEGAPSYADILGVYDAETIILGEVKPSYYNKWDELKGEISGILQALRDWDEKVGRGASGEYVAFATYVFSGAGSLARGQTYVVSSSWVTPASVDSLVVPPGVDAARFKYVYALFDEASGWVVVGVFDVSPKADYNPLTDGEWLKKVHHVVKDALDLRTGESLGVFGDLLRGRLSSLASPYREELEIFIDMLSRVTPSVT